MASGWDSLGTAPLLTQAPILRSPVEVGPAGFPRVAYITPVLSQSLCFGVDIVFYVVLFSFFSFVVSKFIIIICLTTNIN